MARVLQMEQGTKLHEEKRKEGPGENKGTKDGGPDERETSHSTGC